jgi:hypothetical protein
MRGPGKAEEVEWGPFSSVMVHMSTLCATSLTENVVWFDF